jgi:uncharacterized protein
MYIQLEAYDQHSVQAYDEHQVRINQISYTENLIVSSTALITPWPIQTIHDLNEETLTPIFELKPEIVLIGHQNLGNLPPLATIQLCHEKRIALECMSSGAACRTFNVLLSEMRPVVLGIIF